MIRISRKNKSIGVERYIQMDAGTIIVRTPGAEVTIHAAGGPPAGKSGDHRMDIIGVKRMVRGAEARSVRQDAIRDEILVTYNRQSVDLVIDGGSE